MKSALIQAGGLSSRMRRGGPSAHKALVTVLGRTMLQQNLEALLFYGFTDIFLSVSAGEAELLRYVEDSARPFVAGNGATLTVVIEERPLGTIGAASRCVGDPLLVVNVDNLSVLALDQFVAFHIDEGAAMTIATHLERFVMPFGEVVIDRGEIIALNEKPHRDYSISSGTYVLSSAAMSLIDGEESIGAPELFRRVRATGLCVRAYEHRLPWIDVNDRADVLRAEALITAQWDQFERLVRR